MPWNWELHDWPKFKFKTDNIAQKERQFLLSVGKACATLKNIDEKDSKKFIVEILSTEGLESARIEGEILDRESLQSSIKRNFGLLASRKPKTNQEYRMAKLLCEVYDTYQKPLTHEMLCAWHFELFHGHIHIEDCGHYRTHAEPMQIVSNNINKTHVFFEAPPSVKVPKEMNAFIDWFNSQNNSQSILIKAAISHVYFESIHPFEDGNGRIGRLLIEKILSQGVNKPILIATSQVLEKRKKEYYAHLEKCNRTLDIQSWVDFFVDVILQGQKQSLDLLNFLIAKTKLLTTLSGQINSRQEKALLRMFAEGLDGFKGGLSAENYIAITKTSRATATRDLADLVQKGALIKTGELKHTRYWINLTFD